MANIGINLFSLHDFCQTPSELAETMKKVKAIGYDNVQISGIKSYDPAEVGRIAADNGLVISASHLGWDKFLDDFDWVVKTHHTWNCRHTAIGGLSKEYFSASGAEKFIAELKPVAEALAKEGLDFSYHNHNHEFALYDGKTFMDRLFDGTDAAMLNFEIDTHWVQAGGASPVVWVKKMQGRMPLLHLKDMTVTPDREQRFAPVGEGNLDWSAIFDAAAESGVEYYLVEQDRYWDADPFESVASSFRFIKANIG